MTVETQEKKPQWCWQGEFAHCADDCGSMYCELTGAEWNTWNNEDECQECPYGCWNAEDWHEAMECVEAER